MSVDDKYTYPGSGGVLVNKYDIRDGLRLDELLNDFASVNWAEMRLEPAPERFTVDYLQTIHRRMFDEVLPFAGQLRDVDAQATGVGIPYCRPEFIAETARVIDAGLLRDNYLRNMPQDQFSARLAHHWGELTALHPMRDGNTRSQSAFVSQLAAAAGYQVDWTRVDVDQLRELRLRAVTNSSVPLQEYLRERVVKIHPNEIPGTQAGLAFAEIRKFANLDQPLRGGDMTKPSSSSSSLSSLSKSRRNTGPRGATMNRGRDTGMGR